MGFWLGFSIVGGIVGDENGIGVRPWMGTGGKEGDGVASFSSLFPDFWDCDAVEDL